MGGYGSGRWSIEKKEVVENCLILDLGTILQHRNPRASLSGTLSPPGGRYFRADYKTYPSNREDGEQEAILIVYYNLLFSGRNASMERQRIREEIPLTRTSLGCGRKRWAMRCPLVIEGERAEWCNRISRRLYLPDGQSYFGCRKCHELSYLSSRDNHRYEDLYQMLSEGTGRVMSSGEIRSWINRKVRERQTLREDTDTGGLLAAFERRFG
jgi:hypothetical protein